MTQSAPEELKTEMVRMYGEGMSIRAIGLATGRSYGCVHKVLEDRGVTFRSRGGNRKKTPAAAEVSGN
ncbi:helix-turn-helix domain-containing protein [Nonomuraea sp. M3C6]|uniref:Helix-turn-helix domain-containing protein n=1 Tax=Nonomuraea marmarensis TaxID=3351344 RepID=A0ABW7AT63_9ACTN